MAALLQLGVFLVLERRMKRTGGPGIIPFELAGSRQEAQRILNVWGSEGRAAARRSLMLDYLFPPTYATLHALACTVVSEGLARHHPRLAGVSGPLVWVQLSAAAFDYIENTALLLVLSGRDGRLPALARRAAMIKFAVIYTGWAYMAVGSAAARVQD